MRLTASHRETLRVLLNGAASVRTMPGGNKGLIRAVLAVHLHNLAAEGLVKRDAAGFYSITEAGRAEAEK